MIAIWRIEKEKYASESFSGDGAYLYGGRWNHPGTKVVYAAQTLALAALEKFVHLESGAAVIDFVYFKITIPKQIKIKILDYSLLPSNWRDFPVPDRTMDVGRKWAQRNESVLLRIPSTIIPVESDYLINPLHADFHHLKISKPQPFYFDTRMWK
ncbi:MAG: RES domain-containing protein [Elusimicrobiota bacterium]|nr:RES domain-containing protein [Elusimicrobiota bacterium]